MTAIAGVILTRDEETNIEACIDTLRWTDELIVFDSFSTDSTVSRAESAGARVVQHPFENYGAQREAALKVARSEWVFFVDADERIPPELAAEIREKIEGPERGWWVPRHNYIFGRLTLGAGWFPDYQLRVLHRASARYDPLRPVHEEVILDGQAGYLETPLIHHNYRDRDHFIDKQEKYTDIEAELRFSQGLKPKARTYIGAPLRQFWWRFVTLKGYRDGLHGLDLSLMMAYYEFQTWRRVAWRWQTRAI
ncbi:MAG: glycosyltransferase family 2 protein [Anaerolineae bacterium]|nr:glycosyltransferase family 2 protein [Anaerolineae bacterium]